MPPSGWVPSHSLRTMTTTPLSRRALVLGGVGLVGSSALAGCAIPLGSLRRKASPTPAGTAPSEESLSAADLAERLRGALGATPSARFRSQREKTFGQALGWTATGVVTYPPTGPSPHARYSVLLDAGGRADILLQGDAMYVRVGKAWQKISTSTLTVDGQRLDHEIRLTTSFLGQAAVVPTARFRRSAVSGMAGTTQWTGSLTGEEWLGSLPPALAARMGPVTALDVQLYLDAAGRPVRRIDAVRPNSLEFTIETTWQRWGAPVSVPSVPVEAIPA